MTLLFRLIHEQLDAIGAPPALSITRRLRALAAERDTLRDALRDILEASQAPDLRGLRPEGLSPGFRAYRRAQELTGWRPTPDEEVPDEPV